MSDSADDRRAHGGAPGRPRSCADALASRLGSFTVRIARRPGWRSRSLRVPYLKSAGQGKPRGPNQDAEATLEQQSAPPVILIVEDDDAIREIVRRVLKAEGCVVHTAANGIEGLERFYLTLPDLIVLDVKMPRMAGRH